MPAQTQQQHWVGCCGFCDDIWLSSLDSVKGLQLAKPVSHYRVLDEWCWILIILRQSMQHFKQNATFQILFNIYNYVFYFHTSASFFKRAPLIYTHSCSCRQLERGFSSFQGAALIKGEQPPTFPQWQHATPETASSDYSAQSLPPFMHVMRWGSVVNSNN